MKGVLAEVGLALIHEIYEAFWNIPLKIILTFEENKNL